MQTKFMQLRFLFAFSIYFGYSGCCWTAAWRLNVICSEGNELELSYINAVLFGKEHTNEMSEWLAHRDNCQCGTLPPPRIFWRVMEISDRPAATRIYRGLPTRKEALELVRSIEAEHRQADIFAVDAEGKAIELRDRVS
jgi:hypothetical protein